MHKDSISQKRIEKYVSAHVLKQLDCPDHTFSLRKITQGRMSHSTFFLEIDGYAPLILKATLKRYRFNRLLQCQDILVRHNIPVPKIVFAGEDPKLFVGKRMYVICEERIEGSTFLQVDLTPEIIKDSAHLFLRLHRIKRTLWGKLNERGRSDSLFFFLIKNIQKKVRKLNEYDQSFPFALVNSIVDYCKRFQREVEEINTFSLCHKDPTKENIMLDKNKSLYLIDIDEMGCFPPFIDFYMTQFSLLEGNEAKIRLFEEAYMQGLTPEEKRELKIAQPLFKLFVLVHIAVRISGFAQLNTTFSIVKKEIERILP